MLWDRNEDRWNNASISEYKEKATHLDTLEQEIVMIRRNEQLRRIHGKWSFNESFVFENPPPTHTLTNSWWQHKAKYPT